MKHGKLIFSDQYESMLLARIFGNRGSKITSQVYKGDNIFCDTASSKISVHNQVSFTSEDKIMYKLKSEIEDMGEGVPVESYSTDNGIYMSKEFTRDMYRKVQGIRHSVVEGYHHNGVAENVIKNVVIIARTMMIHDALR